MKSKVRLCGAVSKHDRHDHLFCTALQLGECYQALYRASKEEETGHNDMELDCEPGRPG